MNRNEEQIVCHSNHIGRVRKSLGRNCHISFIHAIEMKIKRASCTRRRNSRLSRAYGLRSTRSPMNFYET